MFVGSGAPKGKELKLPGRQDSDRVHIGIDWLHSIAFGHTDKIGERVLIIGVGNTAMDCCRSSLRLGAKDVKVMARKSREFFKASEWELEDAEGEGVAILVNHSPKAIVMEHGKLTGMLFDELEYQLKDGKIVGERVLREVLLPSDDIILAIGQENAFPWIERDLGIEFDQVDGAQGRPADLPATRVRTCSSAATRRSAPRTSSGRSSTATRRRSRSTASARAATSRSARRAE